MGVVPVSKQTVYLITIVLCILLQAGIAPAIAIMGCKPNFLLIPVLLISMRSGTAAGSIAGFSLGLLYDLMGSGTIGCMALVLTLIAFIVGVAGESMDNRHSDLRAGRAGQAAGGAARAAGRGGADERGASGRAPRREQARDVPHEVTSQVGR